MGIIEKKNGTSTERHFVLGSVFSLRNTQPKYEEVTLPKNAQTLQLLQAPKNVDPQVDMANNMVIVDNSAISNETTGMDGSTSAGSEFKVTSDQISLYTVRNGDTLEGIAKMYDVTANTIRWANDIGAKESIKPNQVLVILPVAGVKYTVKKADTVAKIAKAYGADAKEIADFNNIDSNQALVAGTTIIIPDADGSIGPGHESSTVAKTDTKTKAATNANTKTGTVSSSLSRPVAGGIRTQGIHGHNGVDIAAPLNTPILAAASGEVIISRYGGWNGGYGNYVVIKHSNGTQTLYAHMNETMVSQGDKVTKGQQIGKMGNTGDSSGVHLHFEVRGGKNPF